MRRGDEMSEQPLDLDALDALAAKAMGEVSTVVDDENLREACPPSVVRRMIARIRALEAECKAWREADDLEDRKEGTITHALQKHGAMRRAFSLRYANERDEGARS